MATGTDHLAMNTVIHSALRRDLARLDVVLADSLPPIAGRRCASSCRGWCEPCTTTTWARTRACGRGSLAKRPEAAELAAINGAEHDARSSSL